MEDLKSITADFRMSGMDGLQKTFDLELELWSEFKVGLNHEMSSCSKGSRN